MLWKGRCEMKFKAVKWLASVLALLLMLGSVSAAGPESSAGAEQSGAPALNNGKKWRIAYVESDPYVNYAGTFYYLIKGLEKIGWVKGVEGLPFKAGQEDARPMWDYLTSHDTGPYIEFVKDGFYSLISMPADADAQLVDRLNTKQDIDLLIVMGTSAGRKLTGGKHNVRTMVFSTSNAVTSGIVKSENDSGSDQLWAHMDTMRYKRQIQVFHDIFHFKKLGMMYEDSENGRVYAALSDVQDVAKERGFELVTAFVEEPKNADDNARYEADVLAASQKLATQVDAMYLSSGRWNVSKLPQLLKPYYDNKIPVFSQQGSAEVENGALLSLYRANFSGVGSFGAETIAKTFKGTALRELPQIFGDTPSIVINLEVADRIGYKTPFDILLAADEIFTSIKALK